MGLADESRAKLANLKVLSLVHENLIQLFILLFVHTEKNWCKKTLFFS